MNFGIVGSRTFNNKELFEAVMKRVISAEGNPLKIVSGGAAGADSLAEKWAKENKIDLIIFYPEYELYNSEERNWKAAKERNTTIVNNSDLIIAFWDMKSTGTLDTIEKAKASNRVIYLYNWLNNYLMKMKNEDITFLDF